tara:strand:+ start:7733 stop:8287 length:555 start_codon:yes stop_codon:yes gene_type:complete
MANTYIEYTTGGSSINQLQQAVFSYSGIEVLNVNDIKAFAVKSDGNKHEFTISSRNANTKRVTLSELPSSLSPSVSKVRIYRQTSSDALVDFVDGARLTESDLDTAYRQGLFTAQEIAEDASGIGTTLNNVTDITLGGLTTTSQLKISNGSAPSTPSGGGVLYVENGALKYKGALGSITTLANS